MAATKIETLKTKSLGGGYSIQVTKIQFALMKNGTRVELFEVSCFKRDKSEKNSRVGVERFLLPERALTVMEKRVLSADPMKPSGDRNAVDPSLIDRYV